MKKTLITLALIALILSTISITALAHCGGRGFSTVPTARQTTTYSYEQCPFDDCYLSGIHEHDGAYYRCAHTGYCGGYYEGYCNGYGGSGSYNNNTSYNTSSANFSYRHGCARFYPQ